MTDKKQQVAGFALRRFMQSGYSPVTMEEIARGCGIGKASLYAMFPAKEKLLLYCINSFTAQVEEQTELILQNAQLSPFEKLQEHFALIYRALSQANEASIADIWRNVPAAAELIDNKRRKIILRNISILLREGKEDGIFEDVDEAFTAELLAASASHFVAPEAILRLGITPDKMIQKVLTLVLWGCLSEKGRQQFSPAPGTAK